MVKPKYYTLKEIAAAYGRPISTTCTHIQNLIVRGMFIKESQGYYSDKETRLLASLLPFNMQDLPNGKSK
jgi:hypothetical protein